MAKKLEDTWLSDDPLDRLEDELFGRSHLIDRTLEVLAGVSRQSASSIIGLVGAWGSGKSTVLNGLIQKLSAPDAFTSETMEREWRVAEFNPWLFAGSAALHRGFFTAIRNALPEDQRWKQAKQDLIDFGHKVSPITAVAGLFGIDGQSATNGLLEAITDDVVTTRDRIAAALMDLKQPILVVLDDLDRLTADELLQVFKLVRLAGRLPYVYYLLSYDEHTLVDLLSHTDLVSTGDERRGLDYLEKIVQVRIDMPLLRPFEVDRVVASAITHLARKHKIRLDSHELQEIITRFDDLLSKRLRSPRAIKRVFGQVDAFLGAVGAEVDYGDYLVVTWLRTMEPGVYLLLQKRRDELLGSGGGLWRAMEAPHRSAEARRAAWIQALTDAHVRDADADDILWLLGTLFDSVGRVHRLEDPAKTSGSRPQPLPGKLQHPEYFDRFFAFGVPADDLADAVADRALAEVNAGSFYDAAVQRVFDVFVEQPDLAVSKLHRSVGLAGSLAPGTFAWVKILWESADRVYMRGRVENLASIVLMKVPEPEALTVANDLMEDDAGLNYVSAVNHVLAANAYGARLDIERRQALSERLEPSLRARFVERFLELSRASDSPLQLDQYATDTMWHWRHRDPEGLRDFLSSAMSNGWPVVNTVAWLAPVSTSDGERYFLNRDTSVEHLNELFDLDAVAVSVNAGAQDSDATGLPHMAEATPDAQRMWALAAIAQLRPPAAAPE